MQAIFKTGGKQYKVAVGDKINVEKIGSEVGDSVSFDEVLMVLDNGKVSLGEPLIEGATVDAKIIEQFRGKKIQIVKFKRRKHYRRRAGHRQNLTRIEILNVRSS
jgi:large subunit ribosomal protein L21